MKHGFDLENIRALSGTGLKWMVQLVTLAYGFLAILVHGPRKPLENLTASLKKGFQFSAYVPVLSAARGERTATPGRNGL